MTDRLYYTDSYCTSFSAHVVATADDGRRVYLDRTAFYPTSGGQPHDLGTLAGVAVIDVIDENGRVAHLLAAPLTVPIGVAVDATIDEARRADHMQQHTGQHLLSAIFADEYGMATVSVHFGDDSSTLDVAGAGVDTAMLRDAERRANVLVAANRDVMVTFEDAATATRLRKASEREGTVRIVTIADVDRSACGGTHVQRTGEIGCVLLRRAERTKGNTRIEFLCGQRAVRRASADAELLAKAARLFTASVAELPALVERQQQRLLDLEREQRRLTTELARHEARARWESTPPDADGVRRLQLVHEGAVRDLEPLAQAITALGACVVVVTSMTPAEVMYATSADTHINAGDTLRSALTVHGGRGGGSPRLAQGSVPHGHQIAAVIATLGFSAT